MSKIYAVTRKPEQIINSLGKYLFKSLDGAIDFNKKSNEFELNTLVLYEIPKEVIKTYNLNEDEYGELYEAELQISLTSYDTKLRMNIYCIRPENLVLGHMTLDVSRYEDMDNTQFFKLVEEKLLAYIRKRLEAVFGGFEFIF